MLCHLLPCTGFLFVLLYHSFRLFICHLYHWFPLWLLLYCVQSERWYWNFWLVLIFIERPPSLNSLSLCPLPSAVYFSLFLSASCQHWQSATQALAARLVTDAAAVRQRGEKEQELKQRERLKERERRREKESEKRENEWDNRELALPIVSKGTQNWIRPRPIITARWAVVGRG